MAWKRTATTPTDEEILALDNVRPDIAGRYIGWSSPTITNALKQERAPFGFAAQNPETGSWHYNIVIQLQNKHQVRIQERPQRNHSFLCSF